MGSFRNGGYLLNLDMKEFIKIKLFGTEEVRLNIQEDITAYESAKITELFTMLNIRKMTNSFEDNQYLTDIFSIIKRHFTIEKDEKI